MGLAQNNQIDTAVSPAIHLATNSKRRLHLAKRAQEIAGPSLTPEFERTLFESLDRCIEANTGAISGLNSGMLDGCSEEKLRELYAFALEMATILAIIVELGEQIKGNPNPAGLHERLAKLADNRDHLCSIAEGIQLGLEDDFCRATSDAVAALREALAHA